MDRNWSMNLTRRLRVFWCTPVSLVLMLSSISSHSLAVCSRRLATQSETNRSVSSRMRAAGFGGGLLPGGNQVLLIADA